MRVGLLFIKCHSGFNINDIYVPGSRVPYKLLLSHILIKAFISVTEFKYSDYKI